MESLGLLIRNSPGWLWLFAVLVCGLLSIPVALFPYDAALDICDPAHQSPNTVYAWSVGMLSMLIPLGVAVASRRAPLMVLALLVVVIEILVWYWALSGPGTCGSLVR